MSSISTTIIGEARVLDVGSEEEKWCRERHLESNTFIADEGGIGVFSSSGQARQGGTGEQERRPSIMDDDVNVVVVAVKEGRIADLKGGVRDWAVVTEGQVNGVAPGS